MKLTSTSWRRVLTLLAALALLGSVAAMAQTSSGNLYGTATDNEGETLPGVTVTLEGPGAEAIQVTDADGRFRFLGLDPGQYKLTATLEGFGTVEYPVINIRVGRNTNVEITLSPAVEETITVTTESALLDERKITQGIEVTELELQKIPTARDPWAVAGQTPGVLMDRINVGGNESGQQPNFIGTGSNSGQNKFMVDGVDITDQSAVGASSTYFGFEQFEEMAFSTGGTDVTVATPGVQLNMVTKRGTNEWRGSGSYNLTDSDFQSSGNLDENDLGPGQTAASEELTGNQIDEITQYGVEAGGFILRDRLWIWGSYDENDIRQTVFGGQNDSTLLENTAIKLNAQITDSNSFVYTWNEGEKIKNGRDAGPDRPPETTWDQGGPSPLTKIEDTHVFTPNFYLSANWSEMDGGFFLEPKGGRDAQSYLDSQGVWHGSMWFLDNTRPSERWRVDGSNFFNTGEISHELKWGGSFREADNTSLWGAPGDGNMTLNIDDFDGPGALLLGITWREVENSTHTEYTSFWVQDTFTTERLTVNVGLRYDQQQGNVEPGTSFGADFDRTLLPELTSQGTDTVVDWEDIVPRLGVTYALGEKRDTLLRASFSQFADQLGTGLPGRVDPVGSATATWLGVDNDGDGILDRDEVLLLLGTSGFDANDPTSATSPNQIDPDIEAVITSEVILGIEHAFRPEFVGSFTVTWRESDDYYDSIPLYRDNGVLRLVTRDDYVPDGVATGTLPDGTPVNTPVFAVDPNLVDTGGAFSTNTDRSTEYLGYTVAATKRLSNKWMFRGHVTVYDWEWDIGEEFRRFDNPTDVLNSNGGPFSWAVDNDGAIFAEQSGGSGNVDLFLNSRWSFNFSGLYQLPWGFNVSANINGREGYPLAWYFGDYPGSRGTIDVEAAPVDRDRVDDIITTDIRIDKDFDIGDLGITLGVDVFNLFNEGYVLQRQNDITLGRAGFVDQIIGPRVMRFSVRLAWK